MENIQVAPEGQEVEKKDREELKTETPEVKETEEVKEPAEAPVADEVDNEALIQAQDELITKLTTERDNYKSGMLKAKGKLPEEEVKPDLSDDERLRAIIKEEFYNSEIAKAQKEKDDLLAKVLRENKELKTAHRNSAKANVSVGSGVEDKKVETSAISPELTKQLTDRALKLGQDPKKYIELYLKNSRNKLTT